TMVLALALSRCRLPLVVTYHSDVIKQKMLSCALRPFEHQVFRRAAALFATSPAYMAQSEMLQTYRAKVTALPFGIELDEYFSPSAAVLLEAVRLRRAHGDVLWLTVGRLVYYKGLEHALHALKEVPGKLMVVGEGPLEQELRTLATSLRVADRVIWAG